MSVSIWKIPTRSDLPSLSMRLYGIGFRIRHFLILAIADNNLGDSTVTMLSQSLRPCEPSLNFDSTSPVRGPGTPGRDIVTSFCSQLNGCLRQLPPLLQLIFGLERAVCTRQYLYSRLCRSPSLLKLRALVQDMAIVLLSVLVQLLDDPLPTSYFHVNTWPP